MARRYPKVVSELSQSDILAVTRGDRVSVPVVDKGATPDKSWQGWSFAGWRFTPVRGGLSAPDGRSVDLTRQETRLLTLFLQAGGRTLTRGFLLDFCSGRSEKGCCQAGSPRR